MNNFNRYTVNVRLFLCVLLVLVVISSSLFSSPRIVNGASSIFGFYFGSNLPGQPANVTSTTPHAI